MAKFYVTYGIGSNKCGKYSMLEADDYAAARRAVEGACGRDFAFLYDAEDFGGQIKRYGLMKVPLGPQVMED